MRIIKYPDKKLICGNCRFFHPGWDRKYASCYTFNPSRPSRDCEDYPCGHYDDEQINEAYNRSFSHL